MEHYSAIKKKENFIICHNMDGLGGHYAKRNKSERQTLYNITCTWNVKDETSEPNKKKKTHRHGEQTSGYQWEVERGT